MDVSNVGAAGGYQYQPKTKKDLKEEVRNTPDSEKKDLGVIVEISKDAKRMDEIVEGLNKLGEEMGLSIHMQREELFQSMHRI